MLYFVGKIGTYKYPDGLSDEEKLLYDKFYIEAAKSNRKKIFTYALYLSLNVL